MEMMVHPAAWRCGYFIYWERFYKDTNNFIFRKTCQTYPLVMGPLLTGFKLWCRQWHHFLGDFFRGRISLKKLT
jgi:hypothetical protein